jgi:hypothetical protein
MCLCPVLGPRQDRLYQAATVVRHGPRNGNNEGSRDQPISGLNHTASALAVVCFAGWVTPPRRPTRFWVLAKLFQAGLVTRRVPTKGFRVASYIPSSFPKLS